MSIILGLLSLVSATEKQNILRGDWELIPIIENLSPGTSYLPEYIDDMASESSSTTDLFIFEEYSRVSWAPSIRGHSVESVSIPIPNSAYAVCRVSRFDSDAYPDLLILSPDRSRIYLITNKVQENIEARKREQISSDHQSDSVNEDWPRTELFVADKHSSIVDFIVDDVNHDGVQDLVIAVSYKTDIVLELLFADDLSYEVSKISFDNEGISQLLGVYDLFNKGSSNVVFLSKDNHLAFVENNDPIYVVVNISDSPLVSSQLEKYYFVDINGDLFIDIMIFDNKGLEVYSSFNNTWSKMQLLEDVRDVDLAHISKSSSNDLVYIKGTKLEWLAETQVIDDPSNFVHTWKNPKGTSIGYLKYPINLEMEKEWGKVITTVIFS